MGPRGQGGDGAKVSGWLCRVKDSYHALLGQSLLPLFPQEMEETRVGFTGMSPCACPVTQSTPPLSLNSISAVDIV